MDRTDAEKRRRKLLAQTRNLYSERGAVPAVHPRYRSAYNRLYKEEEPAPQGTFALRVVFCCLLFFGFVLMDHYDLTVADVSSSRITEAVADDMGVAEVWQEIRDAVR